MEDPPERKVANQCLAYLKRVQQNPEDQSINALKNAINGLTDTWEEYKPFHEDNVMMAVKAFLFTLDPLSRANVIFKSDKTSDFKPVSIAIPVPSPP